MKYCRNCRGLGEGDRLTAVNCGNHVWVDEDEERREREERQDRCEVLVRRVWLCGFTPDMLQARDVTLLDNGFGFSHAEKLTYRQLDALSREFGTKKINWTNQGGYHDTWGFHPEGFVEVLEPHPWSAHEET